MVSKERKEVGEGREGKKEAMKEIITEVMGSVGGEIKRDPRVKACVECHVHV